jgi:hypothetical protein
VVEQERVHHNLLKGVEGYDKDSMKHTETQEKVCLPDPEGFTLFVFLLIPFFSFCS